MIAFQTYSTEEDADKIAEILNEHAIDSEVIKLTPRLDTVFIGDDYTNKFELRISADNFSAANAILYDTAKVDVTDISKDHPLYTMSDGELLEIVEKSDEWGAENYNIAMALMHERGVKISDDTLKHMHEVRTNKLSEKKSFSKFFLVIGYTSAFFPFVLNFLLRWNSEKSFWYFPAFIGLIIGLVIISSKNTLPDGQRIPTYNNDTIKHGLRILILNVLSWIANLLIFMFLIA